MKRSRSSSPDAAAEFEDYTATACGYDAVRRTPALWALLGAAASGRVPLAESDVLELGCGTGNYLHAVKRLVGTATGLDRNRAMLSLCRAKLEPGEEDSGKVTVRHGEARALPFPDASFDVAYACQVFHHFDPANDHAMAKSVLREMRRVLRPGGVIFINLCTPDNTVDGLWWSPLIPTATKQYCTRCIEPKWLQQAWREMHIPGDEQQQGCGSDVQWVTHNSELFTDATFYTNLRGPLDKAWRDSDSTWSMASPQELAQALQTIREMLDQPEKGQNFMEERERLRLRVGQSVSCWMRIDCAD